MNNDSSEWFVINNFDEFVNNARALVCKFFTETNNANPDEEESPIIRAFNSLTAEELQEIDGTLTFSESSLIVKNRAKKQVNRQTKEIRYCITQEILSDIIQDLNSRMLSNVLHRLVNKGILDAAYDSSQNDFVFWIKENEHKNKENPETD